MSGSLSGKACLGNGELSMSDLKIGRLVLGMLHTNTYFVYRDGGDECIVIDPADTGRLVFGKLRSKGFRTVGILLTHGHYDHMAGAETMRAAANEVAENHGYAPVQVYACEAERELLNSARMNLSDWLGHACSLDADVYVKDGQEIEIAGIKCKVITTPGHTAGGCCYYFEEAGFCICGDTIMHTSIGRSDFATGSESTLVRSIQDKIFILPEETVLYPGHGDATSVAYEKKYNPFCCLAED